MAVPDRRLDAAYRIQVLAESDEVIPDDVIRLWERAGVVTGTEAQRRVEEVLLVATEVGGGLVGVSSTYLQRSAQLEMDLWHYRVFVAPDHRRSNVAVQLAVQGRDLLQHRFLSGQDSQAAGILFEVENRDLKGTFPGAVWRQTEFTFIGEDDQGAHIRVRYFPGALAPPPPTGGPASTA